VFTLFISHDCDLSYQKECEAETLKELYPKMAELDRSQLHWHLEKDGKPFVEEACSIHRGILQFIREIKGV